MNFKVGDRVRYIIRDNSYIPYNAKGIILNIGRRLHAIQFDENVGGHDCNGLGINGHCWNCYVEGLEKINTMLRIE